MGCNTRVEVTPAPYPTVACPVFRVSCRLGRKLFRPPSYRDVSQVGVALFPSFLNFTFPGFPFIRLSGRYDEHVYFPCYVNVLDEMIICFSYALQDTTIHSLPLSSNISPSVVSM